MSHVNGYNRDSTVYETAFQVETKFSHKQFMLWFLNNVRLHSIVRNLVMLKRKPVVFLPVYAVRKRTITGSIQSRLAANEWTLHISTST